MIYRTEIDLTDLDIDTSDLISLAEDNGDRLYDEDDLDYRIEEALADANDDLKETIKSLEEEIADLRMSSVNLDQIAHFVQIAMRVDSLAIAEAIRTGDYHA